MDCCQGRWAWPAGGGGGSGDGGVTPFLPLTATSWLLDPWQTLPLLLASCLPQVNPWGRSSLNTPSPHLVPSCVFWLLCWQNSYKWLGLALIAVLMHVEWSRPIGPIGPMPTQLSVDTWGRKLACYLNVSVILGQEKILREPDWLNLHSDCRLGLKLETKVPVKIKKVLVR